jgi:hypothetical protein
VKATHWHSGPVKQYATYGAMNKIFLQAMRLHFAGALRA